MKLVLFDHKAEVPARWAVADDVIMACFMSIIDTMASGGPGKYLTSKWGFFWRVRRISRAVCSATCFSVATRIFTPLFKAFLWFAANSRMARENLFCEVTTSTLVWAFWSASFTLWTMISFPETMTNWESSSWSSISAWLSLTSCSNSSVFLCSSFCSAILCLSKMEIACSIGVAL